MRVLGAEVLRPCPNTGWYLERPLDSVVEIRDGVGDGAVLDLARDFLDHLRAKHGVVLAHGVDGALGSLVACGPRPVSDNGHLQGFQRVLQERALAPLLYQHVDVARRDAGAGCPVAFRSTRRIEEVVAEHRQVMLVVLDDQIILTFREPPTSEHEVEFLPRQHVNLVGGAREFGERIGADALADGVCRIVQFDGAVECAR